MRKVQTGLRIPEKRYEELAEKAERAGLSLNSMVLMLIDIGMTVIDRGIQESLLLQPHNQQHSNE